jgi:hypothetical protein
VHLVSVLRCNWARGHAMLRPEQSIEGPPWPRRAQA